MTQLEMFFGTEYAKTVKRHVDPVEELDRLLNPNRNDARVASHPLFEIFELFRHWGYEPWPVILSLYRGYLHYVDGENTAQSAQQLTLYAAD